MGGWSHNVIPKYASLSHKTHLLVLFLIKLPIFGIFSLRVDFLFFLNKYPVFNLETQLMCQIVSTGVRAVF